MSWEKREVKELRQKLVEKCGFTEEEANNVKYKQNLVKEFVSRDLSYNDVFDDDDYSDVEIDGQEILDFDFNKVEPILPTNREIEVGEESIKRIKYGGPGWTEYIMSLFEEDELVDGKPKLHGLRRLTQTVLGNVIFSGPVEIKTHYPEDPEAPGRATVVYEIRIEVNDVSIQHDWIEDNEVWVSEQDIIKYKPTVKIFRGVGGSYYGNTDEPYNAYPEAVAESRAESRAYKKALMLDVVTLDEVSEKAFVSVKDYLKNKEREVTSDYNESVEIGHHQLHVIKTMSERLGIDQNKLSSHVVGKELKDSLTKEDGNKIIKELNKYQANNENHVIPEEVKV